MISMNKEEKQAKLIVLREKFGFTNIYSYKYYLEKASKKSPLYKEYLKRYKKHRVLSHLVWSKKNK